MLSGASKAQVSPCSPEYLLYVSYIACSNNTTALRSVHNFLDIPIVALASRGFLLIADLILVSPCAPRFNYALLDIRELSSAWGTLMLLPADLRSTALA